MVEAEAVDELTVRVRLSAPDGNWIRNASSQLIFQREQYGQYWDAQPEGQRTLSGYNWAERKPLGTGPGSSSTAGTAGSTSTATASTGTKRPYFSEMRVDFAQRSHRAARALARRARRRRLAGRADRTRVRF